MSPAEDPLDPGALGSVPATERVLSGFCHDLNGQLANASGFLYLLGPDERGTPEEERSPREHLRAALDRMEDLVRQLHWLTRGDGRAPEPVSTTDLLRSLCTLLARLPRFHNAVIERLGPDDLPATRVDFHATLRALLTVIDAGTPGGTVPRVGVVVEVDDAWIRIGPESGGLHRGRDALATEVERAGLIWRGGSDGTPLRVQLPRL